MVRKKMEGNEQQRRAAGREAYAMGETPSARHVTTGASKQPAHRRHAGPHPERILDLHSGKQRWRPEAPPQSAGDLERSFTGREGSRYTPAHARVFRALATAQSRNDGEAVHLDEIARGAGLSREESRALLHDLSVVQRLVTQLSGAEDPDFGPRFETKPRF